MAAQPPPTVSQRRHWYAYEIGVVPDHDPVTAVKTDASSTDPEMRGKDWLTGGAGSTLTSFFRMPRSYRRARRPELSADNRAPLRQKTSTAKTCSPLRTLLVFQRCVNGDVQSRWTLTPSTR